jgi:hypothetical protein
LDRLAANAPAWRRHTRRASGIFGRNEALLRPQGAERLAEGEILVEGPSTISSPLLAPMRVNMRSLTSAGAIRNNQEARMSIDEAEERGLVCSSRTAAFGAKRSEADRSSNPESTLLSGCIRRLIRFGRKAYPWPKFHNASSAKIDTETARDVAPVPEVRPAGIQSGPRCQVRHQFHGSHLCGLAESARDRVASRMRL